MTAPAKPSLFGLFRHGQTQWNIEKRIQGTSDSPLTAHGIEKLRQWDFTLQGFDWQRILVSPQPRALQTAELLNASLRLPVSVAEGLKEQQWGQWEGLTLEELQTRQAAELQKQVAAGWDFTPPGGESRRQVLKRAKETLLTTAEKWPAEKILIISHQSVIKCLVYSALGGSFLPDKTQKLQKNSLHIVSLQDQRLAPHQLNIAK